MNTNTCLLPTTETLLEKKEHSAPFLFSYGFNLRTTPILDFGISTEVLASHLERRGVNNHMETINALNSLEPFLKRIDLIRETLPQDSEKRELVSEDYVRFAREFKAEFGKLLQIIIERNMPADAIQLSSDFARRTVLRAVPRVEIAELLREILAPEDDTPEVYLSYLRLLCKFNVSILGMPPGTRYKRRTAINWLSDLVKHKIRPLRKLIKAGAVSDAVLERLASHECIECLKHFANCELWQIEPALDLADVEEAYNCTRLNLVFKVLSFWNEETSRRLVLRLTAAAAILPKDKGARFVRTITYFLEDNSGCTAEFVEFLSRQFESMAQRCLNGLADQQLVCSTLLTFWNAFSEPELSNRVGLVLSHEQWGPEGSREFARKRGDYHRLIRLTSIIHARDINATIDLLKAIHTENRKCDSLWYLELCIDSVRELEGAFSVLDWGLRNEYSYTIDFLVRFTVGTKYLRIEPGSILQHVPATLSGEAEDDEWQSLVDLHSGLAELVTEYRRTARAAGLSDRVPPRLMKVIPDKEKLSAEIAYLESTFFQSKDNKAERIAQRIANLKARMLEPQKLSSKNLARIWMYLFNRTNHLKLKALSDRLAKEYLQCLGVSGERSRYTQLVEAAYLYGLIVADDADCGADEQNAPLLRKLIMSIGNGEQDLRYQLSGNVRFLRDLDRNKGTSRWMAPYKKTFENMLFDGNGLTIYSESDPLEILPMGTYFNTCISRFGTYFGDVVANMLDFNKKVLYARDATGRIIARKMIAISDEFKLVGFPIYQVVQADSQEASAVREMFSQACREIADQNGLEMSDTGKVRSLHGCRAYSDDCVAWSDTQRETLD